MMTMMTTTMSVLRRLSDAGRERKRRQEAGEERLSAMKEEAGVGLLCEEAMPELREDP